MDQEQLVTQAKVAMTYLIQQKEFRLLPTCYGWLKRLVVHISRNEPFTKKDVSRIFSPNLCITDYNSVLHNVQTLLTQLQDLSAVSSQILDLYFSQTHKFERQIELDPAIDIAAEALANESILEASLPQKQREADQNDHLDIKNIENQFVRSMCKAGEVHLTYKNICGVQHVDLAQLKMFQNCTTVRRDCDEATPQNEQDLVGIVRESKWRKPRVV